MEGFKEWLILVLILLVLIAIIDLISILVFASWRAFTRKENGNYYFTLKSRRIDQFVRGEKEKVYIHERCKSYGEAFRKYAKYYLKHWWKWWLIDAIFYF